jgi:valyl-tRNA synthetase
MPFITEELWEHVSAPESGERRLLITASWPSFDSSLVDPGAEAEIDWLIRLVSEVRAVRAEMNVPPAAEMPLVHKDANATTTARLNAHRDLITRLARLGSITDGGAIESGAVQIVIDEATYILPLGGVIDVAQEQARLKREIERIDGEVAKLDQKLTNEQFLSKAPQEVVEDQRGRRAEAVHARDRLSAALERLAGA